MFHPLDIVFTCIEYSTSSTEEIFAIYISRTYTILRTNKYNSCKFFLFRTIVNFVSVRRFFYNFWQHRGSCNQNEIIHYDSNSLNGHGVLQKCLWKTTKQLHCATPLSHTARQLRDCHHQITPQTTHVTCYHCWDGCNVKAYPCGLRELWIPDESTSPRNSPSLAKHVTSLRNHGTEIITAIMT